jgi:TolA-binding protein
MAKRTGSRPPLLGAKSDRRSEAPGSKSSPQAPASRSKEVPPPARVAPPAEAVALFQHGMEAMQRHDYTDASRAFQGILMGFPGERALAERAKVYLALCERELHKRPPTPRTIEERLTAATAALNNDDDAAAEELARSVLGDEPRQDLALYLLAAIHARRGDQEEALSLLRKVLALTPEASAQARADADFDGLHELEAFRELTDSVAPPAGGPRRDRRARGER